MSITAVVRNYVNFTGDQEVELIYSSGEQADSPAMQELKALSSGNNTITVPDVDDFDTHGVVIVPPDDNEVTLTLKGVNGDTGISLSPSKATVIQFGTTPATFVLTAGAALDGVRLIWF